MFLCSSCGAAFPRWQGRCGRCGAWGSLAAPPAREASGADARAPPAAMPLAEVATQPVPRRQTGFAELDRVLGGGFVPGTVVLVGGEPGIGKSTLLLAVCERMPGPSLYVAGEESPAQIALRARRLGVQGRDLRLLDSRDTKIVAESILRDPPRVCVVDSIQSLQCPDLRGIPGGPAQVRAAAEALVPAARASGTALVLVGQVTKEGGLAGPRLLEHAVDCVVLFEGERHQSVRALRAVKNRFGACDEIGLFEMRDDGLHEVQGASRLLLANRDSGGPGSVVASVMEGRRPFCVEVQALLVGQDRAGARRRARGVEPRRCELLVGVVESLYDAGVAGRDVYVNVVGGLQVHDTGLDLALAVAVLSAQCGVIPDEEAVVLGEVGLRGEVRPVPRTAPRLKEARALGFRRAYVPCGTPALEGIEIVEVDRILAVLEAWQALGPPPDGQEGAAAEDPSPAAQDARPARPATEAAATGSDLLGVDQ